MNRARLSTLGQEFVGTKSWRIPLRPRAAAAGKGQAGGGGMQPGSWGAEARWEGAPEDHRQGSLSAAEISRLPAYQMPAGNGRALCSKIEKELSEYFCVEVWEKKRN